VSAEYFETERWSLIAHARKEIYGVNEFSWQGRRDDVLGCWMNPMKYDIRIKPRVET